MLFATQSERPRIGTRQSKQNKPLTLKNGVSKGVSPLAAANRKFAQNKSYEFFAKQKHSKLKNVQGRTFLSGGRRVFSFFCRKKEKSTPNWGDFFKGGHPLKSTCLTAERLCTVLNVSYCMFYPARMPVVYSRSDVLSVPLKTRSQKCTGMYIFDDVVTVGFNIRVLNVGVLNPPHGSKKVRTGMSLLRFFAGRIVEIRGFSAWGFQALRILPTVAFFYRWTSLYIGRGQVLFQNLLLVIAPSIRGCSERMFCFQLFGVTCLPAVQYRLAVSSVNFFFVFMSNPMEPLL